MSKRHTQLDSHLGKHSDLSVKRKNDIAEIPLTEDILAKLPDSFFEVPKQKRKPKGQGGRGKEVIGVVSIEEL